MTEWFIINKMDKIYYDSNIEKDVTCILERLVAKYYFLLSDESPAREHHLHCFKKCLNNVAGIEWHKILNTCSGSMMIKFTKEYPKSNGCWGNSASGRYNSGATIKAMNLIIHGYATLIHSCKNCNPYHLDITLEDFKKPFKIGDNKYV